MFGMKRISISQQERGLKLCDGNFETILEPGVYHIFDPFERVEMRLYDVTVPEFEHPRVDLFVQESRETILKHFQVVELSDREVGVVFKNGRLSGVLSPGKRQLYWRGPVEIRVERQDITKELEEWRSRMSCSARRPGPPVKIGRRSARPGQPHLAVPPRWIPRREEQSARLYLKG